MACSDIDKILDSFKDFTRKPTKFLTEQPDLKEDIKNFVKTVYDYTKAQETVDKKKNTSALSELIVQDFDEEQIWQQLELQYSEHWDQLVWDVANCISSKTDLNFPVTTSKHISNSIHESDNEKPTSEGEQSDLEQENENEVDTPEIRKGKIKTKTKPSIVDDKFFKLREMENFLIHEEKKGLKVGSDSEDSIDMFEDIDDDDDSDDEEGGKAAMYQDFFSEEVDDDNKHNGRHDQSQNNLEDEDNQESGEISDVENSKLEEEMEGEDETSQLDEEMEEDNENSQLDEEFEEDGEDSDESEHPTSNKSDKLEAMKQTNEKKSEFELRQQRLKQQIEKLEEKTLSEAPWQLKGEVDATKRPQNSLLEQVVDFDLTTQPPPIITEQTTVTLEDIIRRRIRDKAWDDVEKKERPVSDQLVFRKPEVLDQSKSKQSLAQVYETEYLKQKQALSGEVEDEKEPQAHTEVREAMNKLFAQLDALCHNHFTPKAPRVEVKIVSNIPAISMEEVAPIGMSDAMLLAPEEIKKKRRGELMSKEERTKTDKNRERRKKKKLQAKRGLMEQSNSLNKNVKVKGQ